MSAKLVSGLKKLHGYSRPANLRLIGLTKTEYTNFQKLQYWGLVEKLNKGGLWQVTARGREFVAGSVAVPKYVWTYRGKTVRQSGELIFVNNVSSVTRQREDYAADRVNRV